MLEGIAANYGFNPEGTRNFNFATKETHSVLHDYLILSRKADKFRDGFFYRAESFYNVATNIDELELLDYYGDQF